MTYKTPEDRAAYARAWRAANPEKAREQDARKRKKQAPGAAYIRTKRWREKHPDAYKEAQRKYAREHKAENLARQRAHRATNIEKYRAYNAEWHRKNRANQPLKMRAMHLKRFYGLTLEDYDRMLAIQQGACAACPRTPDQEKHGVLHVDHDHITGTVRGLLCINCNTALGLVADDPVRLHRYLMSRPLVGY